MKISYPELFYFQAKNGFAYSFNQQIQQQRVLSNIQDGLILNLWFRQGNFAKTIQICIIVQLFFGTCESLQLCIGNMYHSSALMTNIRFLLEKASILLLVYVTKKLWSFKKLL